MKSGTYKQTLELNSRRRNRRDYPNPCDFTIPLATGSGNSLRFAKDPISCNAPLVTWKQPELSIIFEVLRFVAEKTVECVVLSGTVSSEIVGCTIKCGDQIGKINWFKKVGTSRCRISFWFPDNNIPIGATIETVFFTDFVETTPIMFVPFSSTGIPHGWCIVNETLGQHAEILDSFYGEVLLKGPLNSWEMSHSFSLRQRPAKNSIISNRNGNEIFIAEDFPFSEFLLFESQCFPIYAQKKKELGSVFNVDADNPILTGDVVQILPTERDSAMGLFYPGSISTQQELVQFDVSISGCTVPNKPLKNGGFIYDYPFIYVELTDENNYDQGSCASNNFIGNYFKLFIPNLYVKDPSIPFITMKSMTNPQTIRFRLTGTFKITIRLPDDSICQFVEEDSKSPLPPKENMQCSIVFVVKRS
jgi:hypothetical protein